MPQRRRGERVLGPYQVRGRSGDVRFRVVEVAADGTRTAISFATKKQAKAYAAAYAVEVGQAELLEETLEKYEMYLRRKGNKPKSFGHTIDRLHRFFGDTDLPTDRLTIDLIQQRYEARSAVLAVDSHRGELAEVKTFVRWAAQKKKIPAHVVAGLGEVKGVGRRSKGKAQLRIDETRAYVVAAIKLGGERGAAALCPVMLGPRSSEILERKGRDLDDDGHILWIDEGKTPNAQRRVKVPEPLRSMLLALKRGPNDFLFPGRGTAHRDASWLRKVVRKICVAAGVPVVCPHGLRGTHATLAEEEGASPEIVARSLGHGDIKVTAEHYTLPGTRESARQRKALHVIEGGQREAI